MLCESGLNNLLSISKIDLVKTKRVPVEFHVMTER